jgi:hypothetical protein
LLREQARIILEKHLGVLDGGYALESMVLPRGGAPRVDFLTRSRRNARLYALARPVEEQPSVFWAGFSGLFRAFDGLRSAVSKDDGRGIEVAPSPGLRPTAPRGER